MTLQLEEETNGSGFYTGPKTVADIYEALVAAIFLDTGGSLRETWEAGWSWRSGLC